VITTNKTKKNTATDLVYNELKRQILTFPLLPGSALEEYQILRRLRLSKTPFREACMRLKQEGWLLPFHRRGYLIAPIGLQDISDIYELRLILESACAQIAAQRATESHIQSLQEMVLTEEKDLSAWTISTNLAAMNVKFHMCIAELTKNAKLINSVRVVLDHVVRFDSMLAQYAPSTPWVGHSAIVSAIKNRNSVEAGKRMQEHIEQARIRILNVSAGHFVGLSVPSLGKPNFEADSDDRRG